MSFEATGWAWNLKLPPIPKLVLLHFANSHNGDTGVCFLDIQIIAEKCMVSEEEMEEALIFLKSKNIISEKTNDNGEMSIEAQDERKEYEEEGIYKEIVLNLYISKEGQ